jgi:hypothetical protein
MDPAAGGRPFTEVLADVMANPEYVESEEELPSVIERIRGTSTEDVPLVLPAGARFGQSRFDFQLLREYASRLGRRVTIVSPDPTVQRMAYENGFAAVASIEQHGAGYGPPPAMAETAAQPRRPAAPAAEPVAPLGWSLQADSDRAAASDPGTGRWIPPPPSAPPPGTWSPRSTPGPAARPRREPGPSRRSGPAPNGAGHAPPLRTATRALSRKMRLSVPTYLTPREAKPARLVFYGAAALVLLVGIIASIVYMPSAEVDMVAQAQPFSSSFSVSGDPGRPPIPVRVAFASRSASQNFAAGTKVVQAQPGKGAVTFNAAGCQPPGWTLPNGTRLRGPGGVEFATSGGDVQIPVDTNGGSQPVQTSVMATNPGPAGNVDAGPFVFENPNGAGCVQINGGPTTGGTDGQQKKEIQDGDLRNAQNTMEQGLRQQIMAELSKGTRSGEKLLADQVQWNPNFTTPGHQAGDAVTNFSANLVENATGYYFRPSDVSGAILDSLKKKAPQGQQIAGDLTTDYQVSANQSGHLTFSGKASGFVAPQLDSEAIKAQVSGRSPSQVRQSLKGRYPVQAVQVKQYPFPLPFMPLSTSRVTVRYQILSGGSGRSG